MTREEASNILDDYDVNFDGHTAEEIAKAFEVAFKALEQEPCADCISRQQAIEDVKSWEAVDSRERRLKKDIIEWLKVFPPA